MSIFKKILSISEVKEILKNDQDSISDNIIDVFQNFMASKKVQQFGKIKRKGFSPINILIGLLLLGFTSVKSVRALLLSGLFKLESGEKDVYYRLKNNPNIDWRGLLYGISKRFLYLVKKHGSSDTISGDTVSAFVADDTTINKSGEKIEHIGKVFDHTSKRMVLGFKLLNLSYWDGKSLIPLDFSFHKEKGSNKQKPYGFFLKKLRKRYSKKRDTSTPGYKRESELGKSKIDNLISMIRRAIKNGFFASYVLVDKWFFSDKLIIAVRKFKKGSIHLLAPVKMDKRKYLYQGKEYTAKEILRKNRKKIKRSRSLRSHYIKVKVEYKGHNLYLFYNRRVHTKKWQLLVTTDSSLNFNKAMRIYSIRWTIEVFFKEMKQYLGLGKSQSRDFDAQIADTTISLIRYIMLAYIKRFRDYETIGGIFSSIKQYILEYTMAERIWIIIYKTFQTIAKIYEISTKKLMQKLFENKELNNIIFKLIYDDYSKMITLNNA